MACLSVSAGSLAGARLSAAPRGALFSASYINQHKLRTPKFLQHRLWPFCASGVVGSSGWAGAISCSNIAAGSNAQLLDLGFCKQSGRKWDPSRRASISIARNSYLRSQRWCSGCLQQYGPLFRRPRRSPQTISGGACGRGEEAVSALIASLRRAAA